MRLPGNSVGSLISLNLPGFEIKTAYLLKAIRYRMIGASYLKMSNLIMAVPCAKPTSQRIGSLGQVHSRTIQPELTSDLLDICLPTKTSL